MTGAKTVDSTETARVWLITGSASGLGLALTEAALEHGDQVVATARSTEGVAKLEQHENVVATRLDVTDPAQASAAVDAGVAAFGRIDVVVNNAGYGLFGALEELSDEDLRRQFETNMFGALNVIRAVLPQLRRQRSGHLVQISSLDGIAPLGPGESAYAASKFAIEGACEVLASELEHLGIRVTIVEPGPVRTDFAGGSTTTPVAIDDYTDSVGEALEWFESELAGNQPNDPARVARAIVAAIDADQPPLRLALGSEALQAIRAKLDRQQGELVAWEHISTTTGFADG